MNKKLTKNIQLGMVARLAFTLAEVLITLGIIGIVAEMTIPVVIANSQEAATVAQLKKMHSILSQAVTLAQIDNGELGGWSQTNSTGFMTILKPYFKIAEDCGTTASAKCFGTDRYKFLHGAVGPSASFEWGNNTYYYKVLLADGSAFFGDFSYTNPTTAAFWVDINGPKKPNQYGKDYFGFSVNANGAVIPQSPENSPGDDCDKTKTTDYNGQVCTSWVIFNGNLNYLH